METLIIAELLTALGHKSRLAIFRLLVEAGPEGMHTSAIAEKRSLPGATLCLPITSAVSASAAPCTPSSR